MWPALKRGEIGDDIGYTNSETTAAEVMVEMKKSKDFGLLQFPRWSSQVGVMTRVEQCLNDSDGYGRPITSSRQRVLLEQVAGCGDWIRKQAKITVVAKLRIC